MRKGISRKKLCLQLVLCMTEKANNNHAETRHEPFPSSMTAIAIGLILAFIGSTVSSNWSRETMINYVGFGMLLAGIATFVVGLFGTVALAVKNYLNRQEKENGVQIDNPKALLSSIWSVGIGIALAAIGSILASSFQKESLVNYAGFGTQLAGIAVFIISAFEAVRTSANIYVNNKGVNGFGVRKERNLLQRAKNFWRYMRATHMLYNIGGVMFAVSLLFFSLWQLDLIVSGPVWWSEGGRGWSHPNGAYANDNFQSFIWKTTIGQAYDTLFLLIFISFVILFISAFLWPRGRQITAKQEQPGVK